MTDGSWSMPDDFAHANQFGLDWWANSEHGGAFNRDTYNHYLDTLGATFLGDPAGSSGGHQNMWRWQSLLQYSYPVLDLLRHQYPGKTIIQGFEWNVPSHEHCSVAIVDESTAPGTKLPVAQFEYLFDANDIDKTGGENAPYNFEDPANQGVTKNTTNNHAKAVQAVSWLQQHYAKKSWMVFAHPERKSKYKINDFRDFNNAGPDVAFGFESIPGHQAGANRGEYGDVDPTKNICDGKETYGGAGIYSAQVGGLLDALLSEGRHFWLFTSSDFHDRAPSGADFWPGEYCKTWTFVADQDLDGKYSPQEIVDALRSGNSFCVLGDLINALQFSVQQQDDAATMGQTLQARADKNVKVTIRFKSPLFNNNPAGTNNVPRVDHIDLIAGSVTGKISPTLADGVTPNPAYAQINSDAKVIARFTSSSWEVDKESWHVIQFHLKADKDMFLRLRGTNQSLNGGMVDQFGNPLPDILGENTEAKVWANLWFYSNPIFVKARGANK